MIKFEIGKTYTTRSTCDYDCKYEFEIIKRTKKFITIKYHNEIIRRGVYVHNDVEKCLPFGSYSMAPCISADRF